VFDQLNNVRRELDVHLLAARQRLLQLPIGDDNGRITREQLQPDTAIIGHDEGSGA
jgi:hypothetical protein